MESSQCEETVSFDEKLDELILSVQKPVQDHLFELNDIVSREFPEASAAQKKTLVDTVGRMSSEVSNRLGEVKNFFRCEVDKKVEITVCEEKMMWKKSEEELENECEYLRRTNAQLLNELSSLKNQNVNVCDDSAGSSRNCAANPSFRLPPNVELPSMEPYFGETDKWEVFESSFRLRYENCERRVVCGMMLELLRGEAKQAYDSMPIEIKLHGSLDDMFKWFEERLSCKSIFATIQYQKELQELSRDGKSVTEYCNKLEWLTDKLYSQPSEREETRMRMLAVAHNDSVEVLTMFNDKKSRSYERMKLMLQTREFTESNRMSRVESDSGRDYGSRRNRSERFCDYCRRNGHTAEYCYDRRRDERREYGDYSNQPQCESNGGVNNGDNDGYNGLGRMNAVSIDRGKEISVKNTLFVDPCKYISVVIGGVRVDSTVLDTGAELSMIGEDIVKKMNNVKYDVCYDEFASAANGSKIRFCGKVIASVKSVYGEADVGFFVTRGRRDVVILGRNALKCMGVSNVSVFDVSPLNRVSEVSDTLEGRHSVNCVVSKSDLSRERGRASCVKLMCSPCVRSMKNREMSQRSTKSDAPSTSSCSRCSVCNYCRKNGHWKYDCPKLKKKLEKKLHSVRFHR